VRGGIEEGDPGEKVLLNGVWFSFNRIAVVGARKKAERSAYEI